MFIMNEEEIIQGGRDGITDASDPRLKSFLEKRARIGKSSEEINQGVKMVQSSQARCPVPSLKIKMALQERP